MRKFTVNLLKGLWVGAFIVMLIAVACLSLYGCGGVRMAPGEAQKQIAYQAVVTAREVEIAGTDAHSPAATQLVDATEVSLSYTGLPANPVITDYPTTLARGASDAARRPTADEIWGEADGWIDFGIAVLGIFGGGAGIAATQFLVKARQKSRALREVVAGNEKLKEWLRARGKDGELNAFYDMQNAYQKGKTEEIVAAERGRAKTPHVPNMPSTVEPPERATARVAPTD